MVAGLPFPGGQGRGKAQFPPVSLDLGGLAALSGGAIVVAQWPVGRDGLSYAKPATLQRQLLQINSLG